MSDCSHNDVLATSLGKMLSIVADVRLFNTQCFCLPCCMIVSVIIVSVINWNK